MNDTTTPTDQPSEIDAIRARVDEIKKIRTDAFKFECFMGYEKSLFDISRRLLELLDARDAQLLATERTCTAYAATSEERFDEIESLRRELAEAREKALEEAATLIENRIKHWSTDGALIRSYKNRAEEFIRDIRSMKPQPNPTDHA